MSFLQLVFRSFFLRMLSAVASLVVIVGTQPALAQTADSQIAKKKFTPGMDISLGISGQLTRTRTPTTSMPVTNGDYVTQITQGTSPSAGVLGTFHQSFSRWLGYDVNLGYSRFSENYARGSAFAPSKPTTVQYPSSYSQGSVGTNLYETTITYVVQGPTARKFNTFAQFGGGGLWFLPNTGLVSYSYQVRPAMLFGVGMNYRLSDHFGIRAEYRGFFYKNPDFAYTVNLAPITKLFTVTSDPTVSVVYNFHREHKKAIWASLR